MTQHIDLRLKKYATFSKQAEFELLAEISVGGLKIPQGLVTDGASLPRWAIFTALVLVLVGGNGDSWMASIAFTIGWVFLTLAYLFPPFGKYAIAAFVHDMLLERTDRKMADRELKRVLELLEINAFWRAVMYRAVRINSMIKDKVMG